MRAIAVADCGGFFASGRFFTAEFAENTEIFKLSMDVEGQDAKDKYYQLLKISANSAFLTPHSANSAVKTGLGRQAHDVAGKEGGFAQVG
jgi:hypothetical protein